jgi:hypothetical protein
MGRHEAAGGPANDPFMVLVLTGLICLLAAVAALASL